MSTSSNHYTATNNLRWVNLADEAQFHRVQPSYIIWSVDPLLLPPPEYVELRSRLTIHLVCT